MHDIARYIFALLKGNAPQKQPMRCPKSKIFLPINWADEGDLKGRLHEHFSDHLQSTVFAKSLKYFGKIPIALVKSAKGSIFESPFIFYSDLSQTNPMNPIKFPPILKQKIYIIRIMCLIILPFLSFFENQNSIWRRKVRRDVLKSLREKTRLESLLERSNPWVQNEAQNIMHHLVLISSSYFHSLHRRVKKRGNFKTNKFLQAIDRFRLKNDLPFW